MVKTGLLVRLEAKSGKEKEVAAFLDAGLPLVQDEPETTAWFAIRLGGRHHSAFSMCFPVKRIDRRI
jgi:hypothetical protein